MRINLISLGCPKNLVDSEKLLGSLGAAATVITSSPQTSDVIIINTCGFIKPALEETEQEIEKTLKLQNKKVYVFGCAVNRFGHELEKRFPQVSGWFKLEEREKLLNTLTHKKTNQAPRLLTTRGYAYLKISDGCSNHCSYCTIPSIRGEFRSYSLEGLIKEATELVTLGTKEIILIGQDTTRYGLDIYGKPMLVNLVRALSKIRNLRWIRILYAHPKTITEEMIAEIGSNPKVCKYLDLPIQHINDRILSLMNRGVNRKKIEAIIKAIKTVKGISLRTTLLIGFPTESEEEFMELFNFSRQGYFDWLGVFPYFCESGTEAARLGQLPEKVIEKRYQKIIRLQKSLIRSKNSLRIGRVFKTLIHHKNGKTIGHTEFAAPDIDCQIFAQATDLKLGNFYDLRITKIRGTNIYASNDYADYKR